MPKLSNAFFTLAAAVAISTPATLLPQRAEAYQVDCAILLCLSGGFPPSEPCAHARTVFIQRITPFPIEPPLQIWNCPLGIADGSTPNSSKQFYDMAFKNAPPAMSSYPDDPHAFDTFRPGRNEPNAPIEATYQQRPSIKQEDIVDASNNGVFDPNAFLTLIAGERADIDISGPTYDFVRSIRVFNIWIDRDRDDDGGCSSSMSIEEGTYGLQGDFSWDRVGLLDIPAEFGAETTGCSYQARAVFMDWRDFEGNYDFVRVDY